MDPYEALGVTPATPLPEIETAYRLLLRRYHPDLHHGAGPQAVADAESMTQELTLAMARVRADHGVGARPADGSRHRNHHRDRRAGHDHPPAGGAWSRTGATADGPVPCPYCSQPFADLDRFMDHLRTRHHGPNPAAEAHARATRTYKPNRLIDTFGALRFVPGWLVAGVLLVGVCLQKSPNVWLATLVLVLVISWAKTSSRYKHRSSLHDT